jgi:riboflavin biosynthesis pyrimidine reductase
MPGGQRAYIGVMQQLAGGDSASPVDLGQLYAWPQQGPWVRAMMVMSLDGVIAGPDGRSGSISSKTDREIMRLVREESDAVLIGASTMRAERYSPMIGRSRIVIASKTLDLPWDERAFRESTHTPIVITDGSASAERMQLAEEHADLMVIADLDRDPGLMISALQERGLARVVCEGGARLLGSLVEVDAVQEFDVAISPLFMSSGQVLLDAHLEKPKHLRLMHVIEDEGFIFTRYLA